MIPRSNITEWRSYTPWTTNEQVEQDLVISRSLVQIFSDPYLCEGLAFRGGTALHKLFFPEPIRYSEDIDLVRRRTGPIKETISRLQQQLRFLGPASVSQKEMNTIIRYRFNSEIPPVVPLRLKIEINCREHQSRFPLAYKEYAVESGWFSEKCNVTTYSLNELIGTKLRALYQRKKGRDLFDTWYALEHGEINQKEMLDAFYHYLDLSKVSITKKEYINNIEKKINDPEFMKDIAGILRPGISFDFGRAWEKIRKELVGIMK
ncbi:MAG: nucleotidyl transferase AbiEii/AbiGii toxin family protein [Bacteroidales bacterium]|nr:nucleotidyl transferase AbiEii/AbiGii toxin family protein [Bacteroidales bacterium]